MFATIFFSFALVLSPYLIFFVPFYCRLCLEGPQLPPLRRCSLVLALPRRLFASCVSGGVCQIRRVAAPWPVYAAVAFVAVHGSAEEHAAPASKLYGLCQISSTVAWSLCRATAKLCVQITF